jgi:hypothetical protein
MGWSSTTYRTRFAHVGLLHGSFRPRAAALDMLGRSAIVEPACEQDFSE